MYTNDYSRGVAVVSVGCVSYAGTHALAHGTANEGSRDRSTRESGTKGGLQSSRNLEGESGNKENKD